MKFANTGFHFKAFPTMEQALKGIPEPKNVVDKYAVCVMLRAEIVGHLKKGRTGRFERFVYCYSERQSS